MATQTTSFRKTSKGRVPYIPGSRPSIQNAQLLISSGINSMDHIFGGGIPVGTVVLVEEDTYQTFAKVLIKYFLAEGIASNHCLLLASQDIDPEHMIQELPSPVERENEPSIETSSDDKMTIAWRYQNLRSVQSCPSGLQIGHNFDLTKKIDAAMLKAASVDYWSKCLNMGTHIGCLVNPYFVDLLKFIKNKITEEKFSVAPSEGKKNILRVAIHSLGSPLWDTASCADLLFFLYSLRALFRSAYGVCMLTVPFHLFEDSSLHKRCHHLCDFAIRLESFAGSDKEMNPAFKDYHGLFHVNKLPAINSLASHMPESFDLAFKLRRKKFVIEKLHLPPELQETAQREQDEFSVSAMGCGTSGKKLLDF